MLGEWELGPWGERDSMLVRLRAREAHSSTAYVTVELQACGLVKQRSVMGQRSRVCYQAVATSDEQRGSGTKGERTLEDAGGHAGGWAGAGGRQQQGRG